MYTLTIRTEYRPTGEVITTISKHHTAIAANEAERFIVGELLPGSHHISHLCNSTTITSAHTITTIFRDYQEAAQ